MPITRLFCNYGGFIWKIAVWWCYPTLIPLLDSFKLNKANSLAFSPFIFLSLGPGPISACCYPAIVPETQQVLPSTVKWLPWYGERLLLGGQAMAPFPQALLAQRPLGPVGKRLSQEAQAVGLVELQKGGVGRRGWQVAGVLSWHETVGGVVCDLCLSS